MRSASRPIDLLDRHREWSALQKSWSRTRPELVFVVGRRRVGKSYLLARFTQAVGGIYYQATRRTETEQLAGLSHRIGEFFGDAALTEGAVLPTWEALFEYLTRKIGDQPFLLVIDEFPYLASSAPSLTSVLQKFWDHDWQSTRIRLVLCGSYISAMRRLEEVDQPLYGRRTARIQFDAFDYADAAAFVPNWAHRDRLKLYGMFGSLPGHLTLVDPTISLADNVSELLLERSGRLFDEAQHMLDAFVNDAEVHYSIIEAIATGARTWSGITSRVGKSGGALSRPLQWLDEMQIVRRIVPVTESKPKKSKRALYRITDPYVAFWHREIAPLARAGTIGLADPSELWNQRIEPRLDDYMGDVFEQVCRQWVARTDRLGFKPVRLGGWWDAHSENEVDVVAIGPSDELFVAECKWGPVSGRHLKTLRERSRLVAAEYGRTSSVRLGLFTGRGEADDTVRAAVAAGDLLLVGPDDL